MNFKTTYVLFGLLVLVLGVFLITQLVGKKGTDTSTYVFPSLHTKTNEVKPKDVERVEVELSRPKSETIVFERTEQGWRAKEPNVKVDGRAIDQLISQVMDAQIDDKAEVTKDAKQFGLEPPAAVVTLVQKGGDKKWTLNVGNVGIGGFDALAYVSSSERPKDVLAVRRTDIGSLFKTPEPGATDPETAFKGLNDYRSRDLLAANSLDIQSVSLEGGKHGPVVLKRQGGGNQWVFEKPPFGEADYQGDVMGVGREGMQQGGVQGLLSNLAAFRVESPQDFVADGVTDLAKYGLDDKNPDRLRIEVKTQNVLAGGDDKKEPATVVLLIGNKVEDKKAEEKKDEKKPDDKKPEEKDTKYYAALDEGANYPKSVVKVSGKLRDQVLKVLRNPASLRTKDLVTLEPGKVDRIDWIEVNNGRETFQLKRTGAGSWDLIDAGGNVRKVDGNVVERLIDIVKEKRTVRDYPDEKKTNADLGLNPDKPAAMVAFWVASQKEEEKKDDKEAEKKDEKDDKKEPAKDDKKAAAPSKPKDAPAVKLIFGDREKDLVYVLREMGKEQVRAAVPEALLTKVKQEKVAYLDRKLPEVPRDKVNRVVIVRDGQTYELDKEEKDGKATWKFKKPDSLAGRTAETSKVVRILDDLSGLFAERLLSESATDSELDRFGLKSPPIQVTVAWPTDDKKTEQRVYSFGKETEDKAGLLHARLSDRDWVFLVRNSVVAPLKDELADTTVFTFDPAKVKGVKLVGWKDVTGTPWKFDLERKSKGAWTVKAPADYKIDDAKVERLVETLSRLRATKFVSLKSGGKPEHKLKIDEGALEIEVTLEGEKDPYTLMIGAPASADKGYFAVSNKLPGDVFVLPEVPFGEIVKRPAYFAAATAGK